MCATEPKPSESGRARADEVRHEALRGATADAMRMLEFGQLSERLVWHKAYSAARLTSVYAQHDDWPVTLLERVLRRPLTRELRAVIFPSAFHPGSDQDLASDQRTYQAIADAVARTCRLAEGSIEAAYVKKTAEALAKLTGRTVSEHRDIDPTRFARTVWLFVYLKKTRGPGVIGMLKPPGTGSRPSLELTNLYFMGTQNAARAQFADVATYLSLQIPSDRRGRIDGCLRLLMMSMENCCAALMKECTRRIEGQVFSYGVSLERAQAAKNYYELHLERLYQDAKPAICPLDEALYVHVRTLELLHYASFRKELKELPYQRPNFRAVSVDLVDMRQEIPIEKIGDSDFIEKFRDIAESIFERSIDAEEVIKASKLAIPVLYRYQGHTQRTVFPFQYPIRFATMLAAVLYCIKLERDPSDHNYLPHVYGQGRVPTSLVAAIKERPNSRHEEFEHLVCDSVEWYRAVAVGGLHLHRANLELRDVIHQGVAKIAATKDLGTLEKTKMLLDAVPSVNDWFP